MTLLKGLLGLVVCSFSANWASSHIISREVLNVSRGRGLLDGPPPNDLPPQQCKVDFFNHDYSSLKPCNIPFPRMPCCEGFKEIACPVVAIINDLQTDCASNMFMGIYDFKPTLPPTYFVDNCSEGPYGLDCLLVNQRNEANGKHRSPRHTLTQEEANSLAQRKLEIMRNHPKLFPQVLN